MDEVQHAILALQEDSAKRATASDENLTKLRQSVEVNAETIKAAAIDVESSHKATVDFVKGELAQMRKEVSASVSSINAEVSTAACFGEEFNHTAHLKPQLQQHYHSCVDGADRDACRFPASFHPSGGK